MTTSRAASCFAFLLCLIVWPSLSSAQRRLPWGREAWADIEAEGIRGITVGPIESSQQPMRGYGTPASDALLDALEPMGVNWVSLTPFARIWSLQSTEILMDFEAPYEDNRVAVRRMVEQAHAHHMRVLVIPHLWVETGGWRGEIDPGSPAGWVAFQQSYRAFVLAWARDAELAHADALSIGVECKSWSWRFPAFWRTFIRDIRQVFSGYLTYSANWDEVDNAVFWDQLDLIGINAFYPLADHNGATYAEYVEGARRARESVSESARALSMPVLFVEVGYTTRRDAAIEPWLWPDDMHDVVYDEVEPMRALSAIFEVFLPQRWFTGFFVWRYYAYLDDVSQERIFGFSPHGKLAEPFLSEVFHEAWAADATPTYTVR